MGFVDFSRKGLDLELGLSSTVGEINPNQSPPLKDHEPSLTLTLSGDSYDLFPPVEKAGSNEKKRKSVDLYRQDSGASSLSSVKREREIGAGEEADEDDDGYNGRRKLRLTKSQSALLEESFKQQSTLNPIQKQQLSLELKLTPRQVEVWFQNRRARTKLKQTEVDCEFLKKLCQSLTDENRRLQKELQELKTRQQIPYMQIPAATLTMCPSCERIGATGVSPETTAKSSFIITPKQQHLFNPSVSSLLINH